MNILRNSTTNSSINQYIFINNHIIVNKNLKTFILLGGILLHCVGVYGMQPGKKQNVIKGVIRITKEDIEKEIKIINIDSSLDVEVIVTDDKKLSTLSGSSKNVVFNNNKMTQHWLKFENLNNEVYYNIINISVTFEKGIKNLTTMAYMFAGCENLFKLDFSQFHAPNLTNMNHMFYQCTNLEDINFKYFRSGSVVDISYMFAECKNLNNLISFDYFDTSNVKTIKNLFWQCEKLENLDLSNFNTQNVIDMSGMFAECIKLKKIEFPEVLNIGKVTNMSWMFAYCWKLEKFHGTQILVVQDNNGKKRIVTQSEFEKYFGGD